MESVSAAVGSTAAKIVRPCQKRNCPIPSKRRKTSVYQDIPHSNLTSRSTLNFFRERQRKRQASDNAKAAKSTLRKLRAHQRVKQRASQQRAAAEQLATKPNAPVNVADASRKLDAKAKSLNRVLGKADSFGNCFFDSIEQVLRSEGGQADATQLRKDSCDFLRANPVIDNECIIDFLDMSFNTYLDKMALPSTYADHPIILAQANFLRRPIHIYQPDRSAPVKIVPATSQGAQPIKLAHIPELHYMPMLQQLVPLPAERLELRLDGWALVAVQSQFRGRTDWQHFPCRVVRLEDEHVIVSACTSSLTAWLAGGQKPFVFPTRCDEFPALVSELAVLPNPHYPGGRAYGFLWSKQDLLNARSRILH